MSGEGVLGLDPELLEILACPAPDHGRLHAGTASDPDAPALRCESCGRTYPVSDGIPVLLLSEASDAPQAPEAPDDGPDATPPADAVG